jgi:putative methionine-R-sulfoxide reductase with GAF domain
MQDEDKTVVQTLYVFMIVALAGSILIVVAALISSQGVFTTFALAGLVGIVTCLVVLWLLRMKQFSIPRLILPAVVYLLATYLIFTGATVGVRDDAVLLYSLVVAMGGLLLGKRGVIVFGILSVLTVGSSVYAEINGLIANHITAHTTTYITLITVGVTYGLTFSMMYILVSILTNNLARSRSDQHELLTANEQLVTIRASLEQLVDARTRAAEAARAEAETARREAESQVWFTRGHAQLSEQMRGELDLPTLANNIASHLSQYIGAQTGALFVVSGDVLKLTGRYAYAERAGQKSEFRFGENLVGEAAKERRIILVEDIPADALRISSALGESMPCQILIAPLESNGQVLGALEFATLTQFTADHQAFLKRVSESAAIALRTVQTRLQMSALLSQSQMQAEELQAQAEHGKANQND